MAYDELWGLAAIRCEAATVRMLLEELEQLTGNDAEQVGHQLGERLAVLARRLDDASRSLGEPEPSSPRRDLEPGDATG